MWSSTAPFYFGLYVSFVVRGGYQTSCEVCNILLYFNEHGGGGETRAEHVYKADGLHITHSGAP